MFGLFRPVLSRGVKIYPLYEQKKKEPVKTFKKMWEEVEQQFQAKPFVLDPSLFVEEEEVKEEMYESWAWVDYLLEKRAAQVDEEDEEDDDEKKNYDTFSYWTSEMLVEIDANWSWVDDLLEEQSLHVEDFDDEQKNKETFK